jgi:hypothetical protein
MNTLDFISSLIGSIVWPITIFVLAICFRAELRGLLSRLTRIKHGESEAEFERRIEAAAEQVQMKSVGTPMSFETPNAERIFSILQIDPRAALIAAWVEFEGAARNTLYGSKKDDTARNRPAPFVIEKLKEKGLLASVDADFLSLLRQLRNVALHHHGTEIESQTAYKAITVLLQLTWELQHPKSKE